MEPLTRNTKDPEEEKHCCYRYHEGENADEEHFSCLLFSVWMEGTKG
jgi:hypothetical protein